MSEEQGVANKVEHKEEGRGSLEGGWRARPERQGGQKFRALLPGAMGYPRGTQ